MKDKSIHLSENVIIADADYVDHVAFELTVNFERMLGRRIPKADLSQWLVDIALDGGLRADGKEHETQVVLVYDGSHKRLENFAPSDFKSEIDGKAFRDERLGEFAISACEAGVVAKDDYIADVVRTVFSHDEVERLMVVTNADIGEVPVSVAAALSGAGAFSGRVTVFAMQPVRGSFAQEILGYSLMNALGISAAEIDAASER